MAASVTLPLVLFALGGIVILLSLVLRLSTLVLRERYPYQLVHAGLIGYGVGGGLLLVAIVALMMAWGGLDLEAIRSVQARP